MAQRSSVIFAQLLRTTRAQARMATDRELLSRFANDNDQKAFSVLFQRHAGMVLGVCRRSLPTMQDAEDALQATFLVLARKAKSGRWQASVANWLYLTARKVSHNARIAAERRARREFKAAVPEAVEPVNRMSARELLAVLDQELDKLGPLYREPLVLCYLEGLTRDDAARRLGMPSATLKMRLERGRKHLGAALTRRGCGLGLGLLTFASTSPTEAAPSCSINRLAAAATEPPVPRVAALAESATMNGVFKKAALVAFLLFGMGLTSVGLTHAPQPELPPPPVQPLDSKVAQSATRTISGRVVDPLGKAVAGARICLPATNNFDDPKVRELATSDGEGKFSCKVAATPPGEPEWRSLVANAKGLAADWIALSSLTADTPITFHLVANDVPVHGRVIDLAGKPVVGASVSVRSIATNDQRSLDPVLALWPRDPYQALHLADKSLHAVACADLPTEVKTDAEGRFSISNVGRGRILNLRFQGVGIETASARIATLPGFDPATVQPKPSDRNDFGPPRSAPDLYGPDFTHVAKPEAVIVGVVSDARTGKPLAGMQINASTEASWWENQGEARTDADGRYRLTGVTKAAKRRLTVFPGEDSPYLTSGQMIGDLAGLAETTVNVKLVRGVLLKGSVIDRDTGKPIVGAGVQYTPLSGNKYFNSTPGTDIYRMVSGSHSSKLDGSFRMVVLPGEGLVTAQGETRGGAEVSYQQVLVEAADRDRLVKEVSVGLGDAFLSADGHYATLHGQSAYKIIAPEPDADAMNVTLYFDAGKSITGTVVDPEGKPAVGVTAYGIRAIYSRPVALADGKFTALALSPTSPRLVGFVDVPRRLSAVVQLDGTEKAPPIVKLRPWASLTGRIVDANKLPLEGVEITQNVVTERPTAAYQATTQRATARTDAQGNFRIDVPFSGVAVTFFLRHKGPYIEPIKALENLKFNPGDSKEVGELQVPAGS